LVPTIGPVVVVECTFIRVHTGWSDSVATFPRTGYNGASRAQQSAGRAAKGQRLKAIVKPEPGPGAVLRDVPEPRITRPDQVLVRVIATSICGTDYHIYSWDAWSAARVKPPRTMGHEFAGDVGPVERGLRFRQ